MKRLTPREKTALELLANGRSQKEIAHKMQVSVSTIDTYIKRIKQKLGIYKNTELTAFWFTAGNVPKPRLVKMFKHALPLLIAIAAIVFAIVTTPAPLQGVETHINEPGQGGFEGLAIAVIIVALFIYIFQDEPNGKADSTN